MKLPYLSFDSYLLYNICTSNYHIYKATAICDIYPISCIFIE